MRITSWGAILITLLAISGAAPEPETVLSPEVHPDRRVTFRLHAPKAAEVKLWGEWIPKYNTFEQMKRDERGVWSVTVGPLAPAIYSYLYVVDQVTVFDPRNPDVQTGRGGAAGNLVSVPSDTPQPYDFRPVPHGVLHLHTYTSSTGLGDRRIVVYTPPDYNRSPRARFPVLYLLHGLADTELSWISVGRANLIADNLIAAGRARPMIIVMPTGHVAPPHTEPNPAELRKRFGEDLAHDVFPMVESAYRTRPGRDARAIAGLSMGAFQALWFALDHPDLVSGLGVFGGGIWGPEGRMDIIRYATASTDVRRQFHPFRISVGDRDMNLSLSNNLDAVLTEYHVSHEYAVVPEAGHTWPFWRQSLAETLPLLFRGPK